eukprot:9790474-Alexandrium_andersonii.AAC.1
MGVAWDGALLRGRAGQPPRASKKHGVLSKLGNNNIRWGSPQAAIIILGSRSALKKVPEVAPCNVAIA